MAPVALADACSQSPVPALLAPNRTEAGAAVAHHAVPAPEGQDRSCLLAAAGAHSLGLGAGHKGLKGVVAAAAAVVAVVLQAVHRGVCCPEEGPFAAVDAVVPVGPLVAAHIGLGAGS